MDHLFLTFEFPAQNAARLRVMQMLSGAVCLPQTIVDALEFLEASALEPGAPKPPKLDFTAHEKPCFTIADLRDKVMFAGGRMQAAMAGTGWAFTAQAKEATGLQVVLEFSADTTLRLYQLADRRKTTMDDMPWQALETYEAHLLGEGPRRLSHAPVPSDDASTPPPAPIVRIPSPKERHLRVLSQ